MMIYNRKKSFLYFILVTFSVYNKVQYGVLTA